MHNIRRVWRACRRPPEVNESRVIFENRNADQLHFYQRLLNRTLALVVAVDNRRLEGLPQRRYLEADVNGSFCMSAHHRADLPPFEVVLPKLWF